MLLMLSACGGNNASTQTTQADTATPSTTETSTSNQEKKAEHYSVGVDTNSPPFSYNGENGVIIGFDVDILQAIADDQNFSFDKFPSEFGDLFGDLEKGKYQLLMANLVVTP